MPTHLHRASRLGTFSDVLQARAAEQPGERAFTFLTDGESQEVSLTYSQVERQAKSIAAMLQDAHMTRERALLLYPSGLDYVAAMLGCLCAGVVAVPGYPPRGSHSRANDRIAAILGDATPAVVLTTSKLLPAVRELAGENILCIATDELPESLADQWRDPKALPNDLACLQYTSGSTSAPKGVMLTHANLVHNSAAVCEAFGHRPGMAGVIWLPLYHDMGLSGGVLQPIYSGGSVVLMAPSAFLQKPVRWLRAISKYNAVTSGGPNFAYELCARTISAEERATLDLGSWEVAFNGSEPINSLTLDRFAATFASCGFLREAFYPCYGLAEATLIVTGGPKLRPTVIASPNPTRDEKTPAEHVGCGYARKNGNVVIVDPATLKRCRAGVVGEIWVSSGSIAAGYWDKPQETHEAFNAHLKDTGEGPFLRTGDLGFMLGRELFVTGRLKDVINLRGVKHHPHDIERTVQQSHASLQLAGAAAFSVPVNGEERLVVLQELRRDQRDCDTNQVIASIREAVSARHELDAYAIVLLRPGQLPRTSSGKIQHFACREAFLRDGLEKVAEWKSDAPPAAPVCPGDSRRADETLEQWMTRRLASALGVDVTTIDPTEPFARYGLDSVKAASLAAEIAAQIGRDVPLMLFWDHPSIAALAAHLSQSQPA
ncbi:MAG TPA: AMP-binding protein [Tepidisphaeraceae bacterium]|nr:AMP-binding protein [Tepidisphaeraceae bacterium]